jgi:ATP-dependent RNA helicase DeaD
LKVFQFGLVFCGSDAYYVKEHMETISFEDLGLDAATLAAVEQKGFESPSPIQVLAIPRLLNGEANVIAKARTGTGKTAAFGLPLVQSIRSDLGKVQALILAPTRELALQVAKEIESLSTGKYPRLTTVYGGQSMGEQLRSLKRGVEIVVGTPGRVKDHINRGSLKLEDISYFILDEADEMLDMGFIEDIEFIFSKANQDSRVLLFSATMPKEILKIASTFMGDYEIVEEEEQEEAPLLTEQKYWVVREGDKTEALVRLIDISPEFYGLVFTQTKLDADMLSRQLDERGYEAAALHGDIPQGQREKILSRFRSKKTKILVATDVAARGIDIEGLTHVVNYALPFDGPTYVHRIGRTGRAGAKGLAFTMVKPEERRRLEYLKQVAKKATQGELKEEVIPSIEQVVDVKKTRLFGDVKSSLNLTQGPSQTFLTMAEDLVGTEDSLSVLASVLEKNYGNLIDPKRYGAIRTPQKPSLGTRSGDREASNQVRIYVQLGRKDGFNPREIASYFSQLLGIPQRMVDRIDTAHAFTLLSLPKKEALEIIERTKWDKSLPHMHLDTKENTRVDRENFGNRGSQGRNARRGNSFAGESARGSRRASFSSAKAGFKEGGARKNAHPRDYSSRGKTSSAALYKKA